MPGGRCAGPAHAEARHRRLGHGGRALIRPPAEVVALILGGGQGSRLFPLTEQRSKPAVPIRRMFVLTQFNSQSLNRHVGETYRMDLFRPGFVEILAAEQTPDNPHWYQGTADAVRQAARHFGRYKADCYLILAGDHLYRMDYCELVAAHLEHRADITIAAQPVSEGEAPSMGVFRFDESGRIVAFQEKPPPERLRQIGRSIPPGASFAEHSADKPFVASMGIYVFSRDVLFEVLRSSQHDFGREVIPSALERYRVSAYLHRGYWADVGTIASFYEANVALTRPDAAFNFYDPECPIYTHPRFLPGTRLGECAVRDAIIAEGCELDRCSIEDSVVGIRTRVGDGARIRASVLLGADYYDPQLGIGRDVVLEHVIVDKNARIGEGARLVNENGVQEADGEGYCIRDGIIVVPKGGVVPPGLRI